MIDIIESYIKTYGISSNDKFNGLVDNTIH